VAVHITQDKRVFLSVSSAATGEVSGEPLFVYRQLGDRMLAE
jgi:hypothetical protein